MNRKPPSFPFYPKDWKASLTVRRMTPAERGFYIQLLAEAWDSAEPGFIPNGAPIWWIAGAKSEEEFKPSAEVVLSCFKRDNRGRYYNEKLVAERYKQIHFREMCSRAGKKQRHSKNANNTNNRYLDGEVPLSESLQAAQLSKIREKKLFAKPSLAEVSEYMLSLGMNGNTPQKFMDFYDSKGWLVGKSPMKDWKAAVRTWRHNDYGGASDDKFSFLND